MNKNKKKILSKIKESVNAIDQEANIMLFGSQARNDEREDSDWDILIVTPHVVDKKYEQKFRHRLIEVELEYGIALSVFAQSEQEWHNKYNVIPLFKSIKSEGIIL